MIALVLSAVALATPSARDQRFCVVVDISFNDGEGGFRWLAPYTPQDAKPARGFRAEVRRHGDNSLAWSGNLIESGTNAGCTPPVSLMYDPVAPGDFEYYVRAFTDGATVSGNTVNAYEENLNDVYDPSDDTSVPLAEDPLTFHRAVMPDAVVVAPPLEGDSEKRWNMLAFATFALSLHDGGVNATYNLAVAHEGMPGYGTAYYPTGNVVRLNEKKRAVYGHELGHAVARHVAGGMPNRDPGALPDGCGTTPDPNDGWLTKEWQSYAAQEGIATWYMALVLNPAGANDPCEIPYFHAIDWDNDGAVNVNAGVAHDCFGDPYAASPVDWVGTSDWLEQAVAYDTGTGSDPDCTDTNSLYNKGNEYEWVRYFWSMTTVHGNSIGTMWSAWDAMDPDTWDPKNNTPTTSDDPGVRVDAAAGSLPGHTTASNHHRIDR